MHTKEDIYQTYQEEIIPLMAEMHAYIEKDYQDHNKDVADLFKIIAENSSSAHLSDEDRQQANWLITKIKIAAYSFIVKELKRKLDDFDRRCDRNQRIFAGIEQRYNQLKCELNANLKTIKHNYGKHPKICGECMSLYEHAYKASTEIFRLMGEVMTKVSWIYPYSPFNILKKPFSWLASLAISILVGYLLTKFSPSCIESIKSWLNQNIF